MTEKEFNKLKSKLDSLDKDEQAILNEFEAIGDLEKLLPKDVANICTRLFLEVNDLKKMLMYTTACLQDLQKRTFRMECYQRKYAGCDYTYEKEFKEDIDIMDNVTDIYTIE